MSARTVILALLVSVMFQVVLPNTIGLYEALRVQLVLIAVTLFSLQEDWFGGAMTGVAGGLMMDLFSGGRIGVYALSYGIVGMLVGRVQERLFKENLLTIAAVMVAASFLSAIFVVQLLGLYGIEYDLFGEFLKRIVPSAAANAIVGCTMFSMARKIRRGIRAAQKRYYW
jgi:rod shape-determining protein MreD